MGAKEEVQEAQKAWAEWCEKPLLPSHEYYLESVGANLRDRLSPRACAGYQAGDGKEFEWSGNTPPNMWALHSSSALVANFFDYWTDNGNRAPLLSALRVDAIADDLLEFEKKFPGLRGKPPNLDVAITLTSDCVIAIESKFTEWMSSSPDGKSNFRRRNVKHWDDSSYFPRLVEHWKGVGLPNCQQLARELNSIQKERFLNPKSTAEYPFSHLDPVQLLKHALGLAKRRANVRFSPYYDNFSLYYLYYDWPGKESAAHKDEIKSFCACVGEELNFKALTYQEVYERLRLSEAIEPEYLTYLGNRYFCGKGAPRD